MKFPRNVIVSLLVIVSISPVFAVGLKSAVSKTFRIPLEGLLKAYQLPVDSLDKVWPGFTLTTIPIGLYNDREAFLINHPSPDKTWDKLDEAIPGVCIYHRIGKPAEFLANTSINYLGIQTTNFFISDSMKLPQFFELLFHETFHTFANTVNGLHDRNGNALLQPFFPESVDNLTLAFLEQKALQNAVASTTTQSQTEWLDRFLLLHSEREKIIGSRFTDNEYEDQLNEGIPTYAGLRGLCLMGYSSQADENIAAQLSTKTETASGFRNRSYGVGAALALLLDRQSPNWKNEITPNSNLLSILRKHHTTATSANLESVKNLLDYDSLSQEFRSNQERYNYMYTKIEARLSQDSCWEFVFPSTSYIDANQFLYDPMNMVATSKNHLCHGRMIHLVGENGFQFSTDGKPILTEIEPLNFFMIRRIFTRSTGSGQWIVDGKNVTQLMGTAGFKEITFSSPTLSIVLRKGQYTCTGSRVVFQL